jgi:hypothetical protein
LTASNTLIKISFADTKPNGLSWIFAGTIFNIEVPITERFGMDGLMFYFAINTVAGAIFIIIFMPETKGKSFEEIAEIMQN